MANITNYRTEKRQRQLRDLAVAGAVLALLVLGLLLLGLVGFDVLHRSLTLWREI